MPSAAAATVIALLLAAAAAQESPSPSPELEPPSPPLPPLPPSPPPSPPDPPAPPYLYYDPPPVPEPPSPPDPPPETSPPDLPLDASPPDLPYSPPPPPARPAAFPVYVRESFSTTTEMTASVGPFGIPVPGVRSVGPEPAYDNAQLAGGPLGQQSFMCMQTPSADGSSSSNVSCVANILFTEGSSITLAAEQGDSAAGLSTASVAAGTGMFNGTAGIVTATPVDDLVAGPCFKYDLSLFTEPVH
ncbi:hypothetical protein ABPG75_004201 [Micractinium tetrahymenae]